MSKPQTQTPNSESFFKAPVYTREELEEELKKIREVLREFHRMLENLHDTYRDILNYIYYNTIISTETFHRVCEKFDELEQAILDAIDESVVNELQLDTDIEKYEEQYNVKFRYESERQLGVVLLKENETVKPVVIWTDYKTIDYYEGEK
jgi:glutamine synthetase adenylyltransferase